MSTSTASPLPSSLDLKLGHGRTLAWRIGVALRPPIPPAGATTWQTVLEDPHAGLLTLTGALYRATVGQVSRRGLLVTVHGLGGCVASPYMVTAARAAVDRGLDVLALNLRGADRRGEDFYHAGLVEDLEAAVIDAHRLAHGAPVFVAGFSLGGHLALRWATLPGRRAAAVAGICAPLDLAAGSRAFESRGTWLYRRYLLSSLSNLYAAVARRRAGTAAAERLLPLSVERARKVESIREWDRRVVAPRHGFVDEEDYYRQASAGSRLSRLSVPALWAGSLDDPMVPARIVAPVLEEMLPRSPRLTVAWLQRSAHLAFSRPEALRFVNGEPPRRPEGQGEASRTVLQQVLDWLLAAV